MSDHEGHLVHFDVRLTVIRHGTGTMLHARKFLANYTILVVGDLVSRFLAFWAMISIARVLGKDLFGTLGFATAFAAYFELFARQGLDTYGIQAVAHRPGSVREYAETLLGLRLTTSCIAFLDLSATAWRLSRPAELKLLIVLSGLMFFTAAVSPQWVFQATEQMRYAAIARIMSTLVFAALVLSTVKRPGQFYYVPLFQFGSEIVAVFWLLRAFSGQYGFPMPKFDFHKWRDVLRESLPMGLEGVFGVVLFNFDMLMLGFWRPASDVGEYSAAYKFINFASAFVFLYSANLLPLVAKNRGNPVQLRQVSEVLFRYTLLIAVPMAAGGMVLAPGLMRLVFGPEFAPAARALEILVWVIPLVTCRVVLRNILLSHGLQQTLVWCMFFAAALNAGLNIILIPRYTYVGSAAAMVAAEAVLLLLLQLRVAQKVVRMRLAIDLWKPLLACVPMVIAVLWLPDTNLVFRAAAGAVVYVSAARLLRAFTIGEIAGIFRNEAINAAGNS